MGAPPRSITSTPNSSGEPPGSHPLPFAPHMGFVGLILIPFIQGWAYDPGLATQLQWQVWGTCGYGQTCGGLLWDPSGTTAVAQLVGWGLDLAGLGLSQSLQGKSHLGMKPTWERKARGRQTHQDDVNCL